MSLACNSFSKVDLYGDKPCSSFEKPLCTFAPRSYPYREPPMFPSCAQAALQTSRGAPRAPLLMLAIGARARASNRKSYGLNVDFGVLNMLLALQPRSSLELGSGMGLYTSWLHKMAGTSPAIGIEPNPLMRPLLAAQGPNSSPGGLVQLVANVINATGQAAACESALPKFDVVFSVNMAEHLPLHMHGAIADVLARHTHGFLLFASGVPGSQGIGHIGNRPIHEWAALFEARGLVHLPRTSIKVRATSRNVENRRAFQVFTTAAAPLGRGWDEGNAERRKASFEVRRRPGFPPPQWAWLASRDFGLAVPPAIEAYSRDKCNATHSVWRDANGTVALPGRIVTNVRVPWHSKHRLREGERELWPELVVEQAKCYAHHAIDRARLVEAAEKLSAAGVLLTTVGLAEYAPPAVSAAVSAPLRPHARTPNPKCRK